MNMSSNWAGMDSVAAAAVPVRTLVYRDMASSQAPMTSGMRARVENEGAKANRRRAEVEFTQEEFKKRIEQERADAVQQLEERLRNEYELKVLAERGAIVTAVAAFAVRRDDYFARAEAEVVQLALAIAGKILHREAQVEPMLVAALVKMAVGKMREGSSVTVRVGGGQLERWKQCLGDETKSVEVKVVEDPTLSDLDCLVETELGVANFGLDTQLKEVEQGFFDLMALRPVKG